MRKSFFNRKGKENLTAEKAGKLARIWAFANSRLIGLAFSRRLLLRKQRGGEAFLQLAQEFDAVAFVAEGLAAVAAIDGSIEPGVGFG